MKSVRAVRRGGPSSVRACGARLAMALAVALLAGQATAQPVSESLQRQYIAELVSRHVQRMPTDRNAARAALDFVLRRKALSSVSAATPTEHAVTSAELATRLGKGDVLIEFVRWQPPMPFGAVERYAAYVLAAGGTPAGVDLGEALAIDAAVAELDHALRSSTGERVAERTQRASTLILQPLWPLIGASARWHVAVDGSLAQLPFAALYRPDGRLVLERHTVCLLHSGRELAPQRLVAAPRADAWVLAVQVAEPPSGLEQAPAEANAVAAQLRAESPTTESQARTVRALHHPRLVHLVAPAYFLPESASATSQERALLAWRLPLSQEAHTMDDATTAADLAALPLAGTQLVVLSGAGDPVALDILTRTAREAGAAAVLRALWRPDEAAVRALFTSFYGKLAGGEGRADALRRAQLELLAQPRTRKPHVWAAFQLFGDGGILR